MVSHGMLVRTERLELSPENDPDVNLTRLAGDGQDQRTTERTQTPESYTPAGADAGSLVDLKAHLPQALVTLAECWQALPDDLRAMIEDAANVARAAADAQRQLDALRARMTDKR